MPQPVNPYVLELIKIYSNAQRSLIDIILKSEAKGNSTDYYKNLLSQVNQELKYLDKKASKWADKAVLKTYKTVVDETNRDLLKLGISIPSSQLTFSKVHKKAVNLIAQNCTDDLFQASSFVGRKIKDIFRQAALEASAQSLTSGLTTKQMKELIKKKLLSEGLTAFVDSRGRNISLDAYSSMIARTTITEVTNTATSNQLQDLGYDLVKMTEHSPTCKLCAPLQGRVYSISGKDKRFPALSVAFSGDYANIHPNCAHRLTPYIEKYNNVEEDIKKSNRPFDIDPRTQVEIDKYNAIQKKNREKWRDRKEWEKMKILLPDGSPKTFSGFRRMKNSNSDNWKELKSNYREKLNSINYGQEPKGA